MCVRETDRAPTSITMLDASSPAGPAIAASPAAAHQSFGNCPIRPIISVTICKSIKN
jgi:hypothetical protein